MTREQSFTTRVKIVGINPYVEVPRRSVKSLGSGTKVPVLVRIFPKADKNQKPRAPKDAARLQAIARLTPNGWFRSTILVTRSGPARLYLDKWMREAAGVGVGDSVRIRLKPDLSSRELSLPDSLLEALDGNKKAREVWERLSPSRRREILSYLNFLKTPAALERNVKKTIAGLVADGTGRPVLRGS